ncbi:formate/nitrite transporter family protein [Ferrimonas balearica]|uniref:formate/nitrite transporter family protein n=1 Tax=Ferrimonas balearica TaxID=44012 RepID=UPI001C9908B9|nr:formate/nitrite transporter family protein [Ferrimonas balearica]MBY5991148.1 formate/nitrite transporter family protein [Ferrimonas balearica]
MPPLPPIGRSLLRATLTGLAVGLCGLLFVACGGEVEQGSGGEQLLGLGNVLLLSLTLLLGGEIVTSTVVGSRPSAGQRLALVAGNAVGVGVVALLAWLWEASLWQDGAWGVSALERVRDKMNYGFWEAVALGAIGNLGLCLAIWLSRLVEGPSLKLMILFAPLWLFLNTGIEHCLGNLTVGLLALSVSLGAPPEFWALSGMSPGSLSLAVFAQSNLLPVTLGNLVGGVGVVGLAHLWLGHHREGCLRVEECSGP